MAVLRSIAPKLVHNSIFFFILNLFFLARDYSSSGKCQKVLFGRHLLTLLTEVGFLLQRLVLPLEGAAIEGRVWKGTGAATTHDRFARCKLYVACNCLAALAGTA